MKEQSIIDYIIAKREVNADNPNLKEFARKCWILSKTTGLSAQRKAFAAALSFGIQHDFVSNERDFLNLPM